MARAFALKTKVRNVFVVNVLVLMVLLTVFSLRHEHKLRSINKYLMIQKKAILSRSERRLAESSITIVDRICRYCSKKGEECPFGECVCGDCVPNDYNWDWSYASQGPNGAQNGKALE